MAHNKMRTAVAAAGVTFAVVLVFMQLGFLGSVETTVTRFFDAWDFDLLIRSPAYLHLTKPLAFPQSRLLQAAELPEVRSVTPLQIGLGRWRSPIGEHRKRGIVVIGIRPEQQAFTLAEIREQSHLLSDPQFVLIDRKSRSEFGPQNGKQFGDEDLGVAAEVEEREVKIVGHFALGTGLTADGAILVNRNGFQRIQPLWNPEPDAQRAPAGPGRRGGRFRRRAHVHAIGIPERALR
jgi:putative ABC transport system permease protein